MELNLFPIPNRSGVYLLIDELGRKYVGASAMMRKRISLHHTSFVTAMVLQEAPREKLPELEEKWTLAIKPELNQRNCTAAAGHARSEETKAKLSAWQKGIKRGPHNHGEAISKALKGKPKSPEHIAKAAAARKAVGNKPWAKERKANFEMPEEARMKMSLAKKGKPWTKARIDASKRRKDDV